MKTSLANRRGMSAGALGGRALALLSAVWFGLFCSVLWAQEPAEDPYALVEQVTVDIQEVVRDKSALLDTQPQEFYDAIAAVLDPIVAFDYIANGVMGNHAKQATAEQKQRFSVVFRENLISTYAKGMAVYGLQNIVIVPPQGTPADPRRVSVVQKVMSEDGEHTVNYTMGKSAQDGSWKLLNVTINGINLGMTFRSQFTQAMKTAGDLDQVIDGWSVNGR